MNDFRIWAFGDAHVGTDLKNGRRSLEEAFNSDFDWDIAVNVGDTSGEQETPADKEGREIIRQFSMLQKHKREDIYSICGNHDRSGLKEKEAWWFRKWIDPTGENTKFSKVNAHKRPYKIEGTWEKYSFKVGNILFLMMSDINEPTQEKGRGELGGNPGGVVSGDTFKWWKHMVESNQDKIIISAHHYVLKNTTVASGPWEGMRKDDSGNYVGNYHGYKEEGTPKGASYLYWVDSQPDAGLFEKYLEENPGAIDIWLGGHTHTNPDDTYGGKSHIETKWGVHFINVCPLTRYHVASHSVPMSRLFTLEEGSSKVKVQCYLHTDEYAKKGWYDKVEKVLGLSLPFIYM